MEYWDLYNYNGLKKKKKAIRGSKLNNDEFHLVVNAWIVNDKGEFLITQRSANKSHPLMWECTGGSALMGETSLQAAIREVNEELGLDVSGKDAIFIGESRRFYENCPDILHVWLFKDNSDLNKVKIQVEEVNDVMWASRETILSLFNDNKFEANALFNKILDYNLETNVYYVGFNANNAICNENFFDGMITLNPNNEKGNIFYTKDIIRDTSSTVFLDNYANYLNDTMLSLSNENKNTVFLAFNKKINNILKNKDNLNILSEKNYNLIDNLNNKKYTRELLSGKVPMLPMHWIDKTISFDDAKKMVKGNNVVIQGKTGSGGNNTFFVDSLEKFNEYSSECNNEYYLSKYISHLPVNVTVIVNEYNDIILPLSVQLIEKKNDRFKYVGADFIYSQTLDEKAIYQIKKFTNVIINEVKKMNYCGILGIDFIIDNNDNVYFMEINPRFQSSSFIINNYLSKYCSTSIAELHYFAITGKYIGNTYLDKIDNSFVNCFSTTDYKEFKYYKILKNGFYKKNKSSYFRKIFDYSILKNYNFEKRNKDK